MLGSTGLDECFNDEYAALYLEGRAQEIANIETEPIAEYHRKFLRDLKVRANLVVLVSVARGLWGLLVAHHCQSTRFWTDAEITAMQDGAKALAISPSICGSRDA